MSDYAPRTISFDCPECHSTVTVTVGSAREGNEFFLWVHPRSEKIHRCRNGVAR